MPKFNPRTLKQNSAIWSLANKRGLSNEELQNKAYEVTKRTKHLSKLSFDEANKLIKELGGRPFPSFTRSRRPKVGTPQPVTEEHLRKMESLWFAKSHRTAVGLRTLCNRMLKDADGNPLDRPTTAHECNKVIEAIKAMNKRDNIFQFNKPTKEAV